MTTTAMTGPSLTDKRRALVEEVCRLLAASDERIPTLAELADDVGSSPDALRRAFVEAMGVTPHAYADALRLDRLRGELRSGRDVTGAVFSAGYGSTSRVYEHAGASLGMTPGAYRDGGAGRDVTCAVVPSSLGWLLVAATERGVCRVMLGDDPAQLEDELRSELPAAAVSRDDAQLAKFVTEVLRRIDGQEPAIDLPLDVRGTAFQRRVWQELQHIPRGETRSYGAVAEAIGAPGAARAVGQACAHNDAAIVIPCHRVVRADGSPGNYGWGPARKKTLLEREGAR